MTADSTATLRAVPATAPARFGSAAEPAKALCAEAAAEHARVCPECGHALAVQDHQAMAAAPEAHRVGIAAELAG